MEGKPVQKVVRIETPIRRRLLHQLRKGQLLLLILYPPKLIFKYDEQLSATWSRRWWYQKLGTWWYDEISWYRKNM